MPRTSPSSRRAPGLDLRIPYERRAEPWLLTKHPFESFLQLSLPLPERERWIRHAGMADMTVFSCGHYAAARGHCWERRMLDEAVVIYCVAGKGHFHHRRRTWTIRPGELLYCLPRTHHTYAADEVHPWSIYWMHVSGSRLPLYERALGVGPEAPIMHLGLRTELIQRFEHLLSIFPFRFDERQSLAVQASAADILATAAMLAVDTKAETGAAGNIQKVIDHMQRSVGEDMRLGHFARHLGLSPFHFSRLFKAATGRSPMDYFNHLKLRSACHLLVTQGLKVKAVAKRLAFQDASYFSRFFRRNMGMSPEQYRAMAMEQAVAPAGPAAGLC